MDGRNKEKRVSKLRINWIVSRSVIYLSGRIQESEFWADLLTVSLLLETFDSFGELLSSLEITNSKNVQLINCWSLVKLWNIKQYISCIDIVNPYFKSLGSADIKSGSEEQMSTESPEQWTETQDDPQGAESVQNNEEVLNILWEGANVDKPPVIHRHFGPFPARHEKVFHIDNNGQVKMGFPVNMEEFDGEIISPLPQELYPQHFFGDLIWPFHRDTSNGQYMSCISGHINEMYMFLHQALLRVKALQTNYMRYWQFLSVGQEPCPEKIPVEKSELHGLEKLTVQKYEKDEGISEHEDIEEGGTSEEDKDEEGFKDFLDPESEFFMEYERDRNNKPICKLVPAAASDLEWDHFTGESKTKK